jgi:hypothetical protein
LRDSKDTIEIFNRTDLYFFFTNNLEFDVNDTSLNGPANFYVQGFDNSVPNREIAEHLDSLEKSNKTP